jgi:putative acyl-CoA dehydrogenase
MNDRDRFAKDRPLSGTHAVFNQATPLAGYNAFDGDTVLREAIARGDAAWVAPQASALGAQVGDERMQGLAHDANRFGPQLKTHDPFGHRIDFVEYHPAYHELMSAGYGHGVHSLAWNSSRGGAFTARAALFFLWNELEQGTACPMTMTFAGIQVLRNSTELTREWEPRILANAYDPRPLPVQQKSGATLGMAMTEKQGGSDLRAVETRAEALADGSYELKGHKWFCSAPMSDAFFTLARLEEGVTCFFVPRSLPDGTRNRFFIQRLKDKVGNRSNASSEIEYDGTLAWRIGDAGRGIATLIEMAHLTRFDIVVGTAGMMRAAIHQIVHHTQERRAFGKRLVDHALMQNVLADLALESEAATLLAFRLAHAFDRAASDEHERHVMRILTPIAKYWHCKRITPFMVEAMECFGGNGYVEEGPMARLYREAPLNGIWEGSGNVICLDVLRSMQKTPQAVEALLKEIVEGAAGDARVSACLGEIRKALADTSALEPVARFVVENLALAAQAALMCRHAPREAAEAFIASRLGGKGGYSFGTLPAGTNCAVIVERHTLVRQN